ncbi:hypothetical protein HS088_TW03G00378 [Tripterygium wilfordii]|uniref:THUMP domain-containing protein n=1 Tax=Tripterygium wilfordii TaxID=458696 RepID=A0A7J7DUK2_TRIWF|nr:uncharacterized protein LOC119990063 [Tripterygium wilfordii]KAF5750048.1 hypothetical protein HS088_TW03G00378 [Tripterygium wilfordii]
MDEQRKLEELKSKLDQEVEEEVGKEAESETMTPWEQHSRVISIPRYDYNAPSLLLQHSHSGFLITCSIKREKSATKEAISILEKFVGLFNGSSEAPDIAKENTTKRRKICTEETDGQCADTGESKSTIEKSVGESPEDNCISSVKADTIIESGSVLSLVKLCRSGLVLLTSSKDKSLDTAKIVSKIFHSLESGNLSSPLWCHRIFPIQATCNLNEKDLRAVVSKLVIQFVNDKQQKLASPVKFAVGYNRRGVEETEMRNLKDASKNSDVCPLLDRNKCFSVVADAVNDALPDSSVDLKSPELCVLVELLPLSGVPNGSLVVAVSVLPRSLVTTKPRLCIKALVSNDNARHGGS